MIYNAVGLCCSTLQIIHILIVKAALKIFYRKNTKLKLSAFLD